MENNTNELGSITFTRENKWWKRLLGIKIKSYGTIHGIDTSKFSQGDKLYLDPNIPGALTNKNQSNERKNKR